MNACDLASLDPRAKMMIMICLSTLAMITERAGVLLAVAAFTVAILLLGGVGWRKIISQLKVILVIIISLFIIQSICVRSGDPLLILAGHILVTWGGVLFAAMLSLRLVIVVLCALILLTGQPRDYLLALVQLKIPYEIAFMVMSAIHFLPLLREEALNVYYTAQLRGLEIKKAALTTRLRLYLRISLPILICALNRAKIMALAMEARAFRAFPRRTYLRRLVLASRDKAILCVFPLLTCAAIAAFTLI